MDNLNLEKSKNNNKVIISTYEIIKNVGYDKYGELFLVSNIANKIDDAKLFIMEKIEVKPMNIKFELTKKLELLKEIESKYIIKIYDYFFEKINEKDFIFIIMEYCKNGNLDNIIYETNYLNQRTIWRIFIQLTLGLKLLHKNNIILQSLSPKSIYMDEKNNIKIGGLDKIFEFYNWYHLLKESEDLFSYISPEMLQGIFSDKCDSWSLGCILYELLFKKRPFEYEYDEQYNYILKNKFEIPDSCQDNFKIMLTKLLCKEKNRLSIDEIAYNGIFKEKIIETNIFDEIISNRINGKYILINIV
jgi:serine/threonine protein kinase